jgi:hypothetical protein
MKNKVPSRGFGDTIASITKWFGIQPCGGCERRREMLNEWLPYRRRSLAPAIQSPAGGLIVPKEPQLITSGLEVESGLRFGKVFASGGGRREPGGRPGPADWEGARRQGRNTGANPSTAPGGPPPPTFACGVDVTDSTKGAITDTRTEFGKLSDDQKHEACSALSSLRTGDIAWDIIEMHAQPKKDVLNKLARPPCAPLGANPSCFSSVTVDGSCHFAGSANYVIFGVMCKLCSTFYQNKLNSASWYEVIDKDTYRHGVAQFGKAGMLGLIDLYKKYLPLLKLDPTAANIDAAKNWSIAGFDGWPNAVATPAPDRANCTLTCPYKVSTPFSVSWYPFMNPYRRRV